MEEGRREILLLESYTEDITNSRGPVEEGESSNPNNASAGESSNPNNASAGESSNPNNASAEKSSNILESLAGSLYQLAQPAFFKSSEFGADFVFGSATSAFQIEGGLKEHDRDPSIWDDFAKQHDLFKPYDENAVNHVKKFEEDVKLMKDIGFDAYRFSISWSRILPSGQGRKSQEGIDFYKKLIKALKEHGVKPFVTLFHWDYLPLALQNAYGGFLDRKIVDDFGNYARICFKEFGDDVDHWITLNEPYCYAFYGHVKNVHPPAYGTVSDEFSPTPTEDSNVTTFKGSRNPNHRQTASNYIGRRNVTVPCAETFSGVKTDPFSYPYIVTHNMLLAHGKAVKEFRTYQQLKKTERENKKIGITLVSKWFEPRDPDNGYDKAAAQRAFDFFLGWYLDPLVHGEYPASMQHFVKKEHLPEISEDDLNLIKGSYDFIGLNYYTARYVAEKKSKVKHTKDGVNYITDQNLKYYETRVFRDGKEAITIGEKTSSAWIISHPEGLMKILLHIKKKYNNPLIYITENGLNDRDDKCTFQWTSLCDQKRISYIQDHLQYLLKAIKEGGVNVKGYFAWSLLDNFEWQNGFDDRFGLVYVDYTDDSKRYPKFSALWFKLFLAKRGNVTTPGVPGPPN